MKRNASKTDLIQWVLFKPYWLNGKRVAVYSSGHQGFRFEPPEGSILWSEWDNKDRLDEGRLVEKVVIGRGSGFHDIPYAILNKRYLKAMIRSWYNRNPEKSKEEVVIFGLLVGGYLVNFRHFAMEFMSDQYWGLRLPFHGTEPKYSVGQLKSLFPNAEVIKRKQ